MSEAAINSELMFFQLPQVQRGVEYTQWMDIRPINSITSNGSIDIQFKASGSHISINSICLSFQDNHN